MNTKNIFLTLLISIIFSNLSAIPANVVCIKQGMMGAMNKNDPNYMGEFINKQGEKCSVFAQTNPVPSVPVMINKLHTDTDLEAF